MKEKEARKLLDALDWVKAALECKAWDWDGDQRYIAEMDLHEAMAIISDHYDLAKLRGLTTPKPAEGEMR